MIKICEICKREYIPKKTGYWKRRRFCSYECRNKWYSISYKGHKTSDEVKRKLSIKLKGRVFTEEHKRKIGLAHKVKQPWVGKRNHLEKGENSPNWKGGITPILVQWRKIEQMIKWRKDVFARDNYKCKKCNEKGCINADHIKPFIIIILENNITNLEELLSCKELWDINNGQTLCNKCHKIKTKEDIKIIKQIRKKLNK